MSEIAWTVQSDASLRVDYVDCQGDPCHLRILPVDDGFRWEAVASYGGRSFEASSVADAMEAAEHEAVRQDWTLADQDG